MPVFVCKTSTHYTRKNEAACQTNENLDSPAFIARTTGSYKRRGISTRWPITRSRPMLLLTLP